MAILTFEQWYRAKQQEALDYLKLMKEDSAFFFHYAEEYSLVFNQLLCPQLPYMFYVFVAQATEHI